MSYATVSDITARYPERDLVALTDPNNAAVQDAPITQALADASSEIDSYLESRFALPLTDPPAVLTRLACDIAIYRLQSLRPLHDLEDARKRYEDAVKMLTAVNQGKLTLGLAADGAEPSEPAPAVATIEGPDRMFDRRRLRDL